jgi:hypothetical protein
MRAPDTGANSHLVEATQKRPNHRRVNDSRAGIETFPHQPPQSLRLDDRLHLLGALRAQERYVAMCDRTVDLFRRAL